MNSEIDYSLLPPCCNSGCTVCVLDYPEQFSGTLDENALAMLAAVESVENQEVESEES